MRTRKTALPALDSSRAGGSVSPLGGGARRTGTRPAGKVTQLSLRMPDGVLPRMTAGNAPAAEPATPRLDGARLAKMAVVRSVAGAPAPRKHLGELREALRDGWEIVQPIFARPLWSAADDSATAFNFVLRGPTGTRLITVPEGRGVERFIRDRQLSVDYAR